MGAIWPSFICCLLAVFLTLPVKRGFFAACLTLLSLVFALLLPFGRIILPLNICLLPNP
jgi:hypothetical protein